MRAQVVDFYEFYEGLQEGWDGPALLVFSDGNHVGARLDRNGLRPARYWVTSDNHIFVASEVRPCLCRCCRLPWQHAERKLYRLIAPDYGCYKR